MSFINDPHGEWEKEWTAENPEPAIYFENGTDGLLHAPLEQIWERIGWHTRRWMAYTQFCADRGWKTDEFKA